MKVDKVVSIARREYLARVRSKGFIISTLAMPLIMLMAFAVGALMQRADIDQLRLVVVDAGTDLGADLVANLEEIESLPIVIQETMTVEAREVEETRARLSEAIRNDDLDGYFVLRPDAETRATGQYYARETGNIIVNTRFEGAFERSILESWFSGEELDRLRRARAADFETFTVSAEGEEAGGFLVAYISTYAFAMIMYIVVLMHGQQTAMAIVEEKSSRLVELIIGAVTATEYMFGKVVGVLGAGLTQLGIWMLMVIVAFTGAIPGLALGAAIADVDLMEFIDVGLLAYFVLFFLLGYMLYATILAAVGATCGSVEDLQQAMFPAIMPIVFALMSTFYVMTNPNSLASRVLSFIPFFTPMTMFARINVAKPPAWEIWLGILVLFAGTALCVWLAAKIFRATILFHGKRPSFGELFRMMRATA